MFQQSPALVPLAIAIIAGAALGSLMAWLFLRRRVETAEQQTSEAQVQLARFSQQVSDLEKMAASLPQCQASLRQESADKAAFEAVANERSHELERLREELRGANTKAQESTDEQSSLRVQVAELAQKLDAEKSQTVDKVGLIDDAKTKFSDAFDSLANRILEEKARKFAEQNRQDLDHLLSPLKTKLQEFQARAEQLYDTEGKERSALAGQVSQLIGLNQQLSQDANNLTNALKGSGKTQGDWGEQILERILTLSGLRKGEDYEVRETFTREDGKRAQPDVIIRLPEGRSLVVDSKVSLTDYVNYAAADSAAARESALGLHLNSVLRHVRQLSDKNYQELYDLKSIDFVIMFVPIEPAFMVAIARDNELCEKAWNRNVLLVSPSTFLFVVRTVAYLWRQEQATRNVKEIAKRGGDLYDKLVGFVESLNSVGNRLKQASQSYDEARNKLIVGPRNLIRQAETLRDLGVKPTKAMPPDILEPALTEQPVVLPQLVASAEEYSDGTGTTEEFNFATGDDIPF
jgi:DNA recombination protein RmuC